MKSPLVKVVLGHKSRNVQPKVAEIMIAQYGWAYAPKEQEIPKEMEGVALVKARIKAQTEPTEVLAIIEKEKAGLNRKNIIDAGIKRIAEIEDKEA